MKKIHIYTLLSVNVFLETCLDPFYINFIIQAVHHKLLSENALKVRFKSLIAFLYDVEAGFSLCSCESHVISTDSTEFRLSLK